MRLFKFSADELENLLSEEEKEHYGVSDGVAKCGECLYETSIVYTIARDEEKAIEEIKNGYFYCGECIADTIAEKYSLYPLAERRGEK